MTASDTDGILVSQLKRSIRSASEVGHVAGVETVLVTIGQLGRWELITYSIQHTCMFHVKVHVVREHKFDDFYGCHGVQHDNSLSSIDNDFELLL